MNDEIDKNDLALFVRYFGKPLATMPCPTDNGRINPHVSRFWDNNGMITDVFHVKPIYYQHRDKSWRPLSEVSHHHGNHMIILNEKWTDIHPKFLKWLSARQRIFKKASLSIPSPIRLRDSLIPFTDELTRLLPIGLTTTDFYPQPNIETTTVDGFVESATGSMTWATIRASTGSASDDSTAFTYPLFAFHNGANNNNDWFALLRGIYLFDTSVIGSGSNVDSGTFGFVTSSVQNNAGITATNGTDMVLVSSAPATNIALIATDYGTVGATSFGSLSQASTNTDNTTYNSITLNASGLSNVSKTSISKFGVRFSADLSDTHPGSNADNYSATYTNFADQTGTDKDPKLTITYSVAGTSTPARRRFSPNS